MSRGGRNYVKKPPAKPSPVEEMNFYRWVEGLPLKEIAQMFGYSVTSVGRFTQKKGDEWKAQRMANMPTDWRRK